MTSGRCLPKYPNEHIVHVVLPPNDIPTSVSKYVCRSEIAIYNRYCPVKDSVIGSLFVEYRSPQIASDPREHNDPGRTRPDIVSSCERSLVDSKSHMPYAVHV